MRFPGLNDGIDATAGDVKMALKSEFLARPQALFWAADGSLRLTSFRAAGSNHAGATGHPLVGSSLRDLLAAPPAVCANLLDAHHRALAGSTVQFEFGIDGLYWLGVAEPLRGPAGEVQGISVTLCDHTSRAFSERSLRLSEQSYRSLIEDAPFGIARATGSGQLLQVNRAMVAMLGYESDQELLIQSLRSDVFSSQQTWDAFLSSLRRNEHQQGLESSWRRQDGKSISVSLAGRAVYNDPGRLSYIEILAENITERKQLQNQLSQGQKMQAVGQLAGGIAHDFNNLLTIINGQVQLVLAELGAGDPLRERLTDVEAAASRAAELTRQLLAFGRLQPIETKVLQLNTVVSGMTQLLFRLMGKHLELQFTPGPDLGHVRADTMQLEQVIMNLVLNAKDATPDGGRITISTENVRLDASPARDANATPPGDYVALIVADTGEGMSPEIMARIFEPFFTTRKAGAGTGLGLAMVYSIVKQNRGFISTESQPGAGSRFTIYLPRVAAPVRQHTPASPASSPGGTETILLAEDEEMIRKFAAGFLEDLGYRVLTAADGLEAQAMFESNTGKIDLLITDVVMPRLGGKDLAAAITRTKPGLRILFISGYSPDDTLRDFIDQKKATFLQKPFLSMQALARSVRDILDRV